jgi:predicted metal-binding membrane protein
MFAPTHLRAGRRDGLLLGAALLVLALLAWLTLWWWEASPYGRYLHHDAGGAGSASLPLAIEGVVFTLGWLVMIVAMMLPSSVPLVLTFRALVGRRRHPGRLVGLLLVGYLASWTAFGAAAWVADRGIHALVEGVPWLAAQPQLIIAATLLAAGLWQFSPLREACLDACRSPLGFVVDRWTGTAERRDAVRIGAAHGLFCIGCCWSLMLVMFGVGLGSFSVMLALGALTAIEKNLPQGRRLTRPLGVALVFAALYTVST